MGSGMREDVWMRSLEEETETVYVSCLVIVRRNTVSALDVVCVFAVTILETRSTVFRFAARMRGHIPVCALYADCSDIISVMKA
jgi:hypothetical protein